LVSVCIAAGCGTYSAPSGNYYYLDPLTTTTDYTGKDNAAYSYFYNYCQYINRTAHSLTCARDTYVAVVSQTGSCTEIGSSPPAISELDAKQGVSIVYVDTVNLCGNPKTVPRISTISVYCNQNVEYNLINIDEPEICQYNITAQSKYACPTGNANNKSDCCDSQATPGCNERSIEACVCKANSTCCTARWDDDCVDLVISLGCGDCQLGTCCSAHKGKGCEDREVSRCVCDKMDECCMGQWTSDCVSAVNKYNCGMCSGVCCSADPCTDQRVRDCVCSRDVYCCNAKWDATCTNEAIHYNCTSCPSAPLQKPHAVRPVIH